MDDALPSCGCAISITIAVMIPMNRRTCADNATARQAGNVVLANRTTAAYRNGYSAMAKTIAATTVMNCPKIVPPATPTPISSVPTTDAFQSMFNSIRVPSAIFSFFVFLISDNGFVILPTIVEMAAMKWRPFARANIVSAPNQNSDARTANAFRRDGDATTKTIAATTQTKQIARIINAKMEHSNARRAIALRHISVATAIAIVATCPTRPIARHDSPAADTVPNRDSSAPTICVWRCQTFATAPTIAATTATRRHQFARTSIATRCDDSNVPTIDALRDTKYATVSIIAAMAVTRTI